MARIVGHLPVAELEARYRAARDVTEARHFQAIWLLAQGRTVLEVSEVLAFVQVVRNAQQWYRTMKCATQRKLNKDSIAGYIKIILPLLNGKRSV